MRTAHCAMPALRRIATTPTSASSHALVQSLSLAVPLRCQRAAKGDYGFNVFHNSNPQHGGSYARHERRMRDDEVEDFLKSVKHWKPVYEDVAENDRVDGADLALGEADTTGASSRNQDEAPLPSPLRMGEEAIMRTFTFDSYREAYLFMGRVWAFCYSSDKYPHVTWEGTSITVYLYSPSFRGLSKREARVAAFLNDQYNMARKSKQQQRRIVDGIVQNAAVEELMGHEVAEALAQRQARRTAPLREVVEGPSKWSAAIGGGVKLGGLRGGTDGPAEGVADRSGHETRRRRF